MLLTTFRGKHVEGRRGKFSKDIMLLQDNAPAHQFHEAIFFCKEVTEAMFAKQDKMSFLKGLEALKIRY